MEGKQREGGRGEGCFGFGGEGSGGQEESPSLLSLLSVTLNSGFRFFHSKREDLSKKEEDFTIERWTDQR